MKEVDFGGNDDSENSFSSESHTASAGNVHNKKHGNKSKNEVVAKGDRAAKVGRMGFLLVIVTVGAFMAAGTFALFYIKQKQHYENTYNQFADKILTSADAQMANLQQAMSNLGEEITSTVTYLKQTWPYVSLSNFETIASHARERSIVEILSLLPLVTDSDRTEYEAFSHKEASAWLNVSEAVLQSQASSNMALPGNAIPHGGVTPFLWQYNDENEFSQSPGPGPYMPAWQTSPPPYAAAFFNFNYLSQSYVNNMILPLDSAREALFGPVLNVSSILNLVVTDQEHHQFHDLFVDIEQSSGANDEGSVWERPHSALVLPVFSNFRDDLSDIVAFLHAYVLWDRFIALLVPPAIPGIYVVLENSCGQVFTYEFGGLQTITYLGPKDYHDSKFNNLERSKELGFSPNETISVANEQSFCTYSLRLYPSSEFESATSTQLPLILTLSLIGLFAAIALTFCIYDGYVQHRNNKVLGVTNRATAILSSLFPAVIRERLFAETDYEHDRGDDPDRNGTTMDTAETINSGVHSGMNSGSNSKGKSTVQSTKDRLKTFLSEGTAQTITGESRSGTGDDDSYLLRSKPIAELFPETTIMFGDIVGFTAWSSQREPSQIFILLETLYQAFDEIARKRAVFKVETVGDCYVAVSGLPEPRADHFIVMARFARDCMSRMNELTKMLEKRLGPDTADLAMRVGLHSGPVTAGVLRGEKSRFQLFGDTMNTASRMETTGAGDRIQISQDTADLLVAAGKEHWFKKRDEKVVAKGKGEMQTYWLATGKETVVPESPRLTTMKDNAKVSETSTSDDDDSDEVASPSASARTSRLIDWNVEMLTSILKQVVARRQAEALYKGKGAVMSKVPHFTDFHSANATVIDEVKEIITLPAFDAKVAGMQQDHHDVKLDSAAEAELHDYVSVLASLYHDNPFHNFEHASHVTMSVVKLLSRIVVPDLDSEAFNSESIQHDHTYGIKSDPLTQFACVLSALIHDLDHPGVPNVQLVKEKAPMAILYKNKSVAEQNSIDLAWDLLMQDNYARLRSIIYSTETEMKRFRQLLVNSVMATDIMDPNLKVLRNARWDKAFHHDDNMIPDEKSLRENINRKATIVIEHMIQASDVAHTMQHWHVYRKWNEIFFKECYDAFKSGRAEKDPCQSWYEGEIGFFDFYIIPLAKKLKDCGVFGVSSDEYLNYAVRNRKEWELRGQEVVNELIEKYCK